MKRTQESKMMPVSWADWDEELLALELQEIQDMDFDVSLTGFDVHEIDQLRHSGRRSRGYIIWQALPFRR
jgi:hypothetical protein